MTHALGLFARAFISILVLSGVISCSGAVGGSAPVNDPTRITILPSTATMFAGTSTTFVISGGTGSYIVTSSNQGVVPISGSITGNALVVTPNPVGVDTPVTLTVRDTGTTPLATAELTVRPGTVSNEITITPSSTQGLNCSSAVCSGGDAEVSVTLSQGGLPLVGRTVRFDAITGDFRFVTSSSSSPIEILETTVTVVSDATGRARARLRALPSASNQTALLQITDTATGAFQRASFVISQATGTSPGFFASPSSVTFQGRREEECAGTDLSAMIYVFGGTPPYFIGNTISTLIVRPEVVSANGASFTVTPTGGCIGTPGAPVTIRDSAGRTTTVSIANIPGTVAIPALSASPSTINLSSCDASANIQVAGGRSSTYFVASGSDALVAVISGGTVTVRRRSPSGPAAATGSIGISDGTSVVNVSVVLSGAALGACPSAGLALSSNAVRLNDCSSAAQVTVSGGTGTYTASSDNGSVTASVNGSVVSIRRTTNSAAFTSSTVTVSDGNSSLPITVTGNGAGAGVCGGTASSPLVANPSTGVDLATCTSSPNVVISGGTGTYSVATSNAGILVTATGNILAISRRVPSTGPVSTPQSVTVSDGVSSPLTIPVRLDPAAQGNC